MSGNIQISGLAQWQNSHSMRTEGRLQGALASKVLASPGTHLWASSFSSLMPSSSGMAGEFIATLFGKSLTPGEGFTSNWHFWQV